MLSPEQATNGNVETHCQPAKQSKNILTRKFTIGWETTPPIKKSGRRFLLNILPLPSLLPGLYFYKLGPSSSTFNDYFYELSHSSLTLKASTSTSSVFLSPLKSLYFYYYAFLSLTIRKYTRVTSSTGTTCTIPKPYRSLAQYDRAIRMFHVPERYVRFNLTNKQIQRVVEHWRQPLSSDNLTSPYIPHFLIPVGGKPDLGNRLGKPASMSKAVRDCLLGRGALGQKYCSLYPRLILMKCKYHY